MVILLCYTSAFSEMIYANFYAKILDWNFRLIHENSQILVVVFLSKLNFSFSFRFVDKNCRIFLVVVVFVTRSNLFSSTKIFVFVVVDEKTLTDTYTHAHTCTVHTSSEQLQCHMSKLTTNFYQSEQIICSIRYTSFGYFRYGKVDTTSRNASTHSMVVIFPIICSICYTSFGYFIFGKLHKTSRNASTYSMVVIFRRFIFISVFCMSTNVTST